MHTPLDAPMKRSQRTLISAVLSQTQLDVTQLHHPIFEKALFPPKHQWCSDVLPHVDRSSSKLGKL